MTADLATRRLALRFRLEQSLFLARAEGAAAALDRMGLLVQAQELRAVAEHAETASQALLARVEPPTPPESAQR